MTGRRLSIRGPLGVITARLGRRGAFLVILGGAWVLQGVSIWHAAPPMAAPGMDLLLYERIPIPIRSVLWLTTGLVAMAHAWRRGPGEDAIGYGALIFLPAERVISGLLACALSLSASVQFTPRALLVASTWLGVVAAVRIVAGWPEPEGFSAPRRAQPRGRWRR